jgi:hypothetical protein
VDGGEFWLLVSWGKKRLWFWDFFVVGEAVARRLRSAKPRSYELKRFERLR